MEQLLSNEIFWFVLSTVPLTFLFYTLINLKRLKIRITHGRVLVELFIFLSFLVIGFSIRQKQGKSFFERIQPVSKESGFKMDGYWVWGGSIINVENEYHMFAARWPKDVYDHEIKYKDAPPLQCTRRERPQLYIEKGKVKALLTGVYSGEDSWCQVVAINPGY